MDLVSKECKSLVSILPSEKLQETEEELSSSSHLSTSINNEPLTADTVTNINSLQTKTIEKEKNMRNFSYNLNKSNKALVQSANIPTGWCSWYHFYEKIDEISLFLGD